MRLFLFAFSVILIASQVPAAVASDNIISFPGRKCIKAPFAKVLESITGYSTLHSIPEANYTMGPISIMRMLPVLEMPKADGNHDDSIVRFRLVPMNVKDEALFPRFMIRCQMAHPTADSARQECHWLTASDLAEYGRPGAPPASFGLSDFNSTMTLNDGGGCGKGQTEINYEVNIAPVGADVDKIQAAAGFGGFPIPQEQFYKGYFENFYNGWLKRVGK